MPSVVLFSHPYVSSCDVDLSRKVRLRYTLPYLGGQLTEKLRTQHSVPDEALGCAGAFFGAAVVSDCALLRHPGTRFLFKDNRVNYDCVFKRITVVLSFF